VKKTLHPAGMELFSFVTLTDTGSVSATSARAVGPVLSVIVQFLKILSQTAAPVSIRSINIENVISVNPGINNILGKSRIGTSTYSTLERFKFEYEDLQIQDLGNTVINDITLNPLQYVPFTPPNSVVLESI